MINTCDCGRPCKDGRYGCPPCRALDGESYGEGAAIACLREFGTATPTEIADYAGLCREQVYRVLAKLRSRGRVVFREVFENRENHTRWRGQVRPTKIHYYELRSA